MGGGVGVVVLLHAAICPLALLSALCDADLLPVPADDLTSPALEVAGLCDGWWDVGLSAMRNFSVVEEQKCIRMHKDVLSSICPRTFFRTV